MRIVVRVALLLALVGVVAALWAWTPLHTVRGPADLQRVLAPVVDSPWLPAALLLAFVVAGLLFISVWVVIVQTCLLLPPAAAFPLALGGALLSSLIFYGVGRALGRGAVERFAPARVQRAVAGAGLETIIAVRVLPLLPYTFVNLCCGAFGVDARVFVLGTVLGMTPGIAALAVLGERVVAVLREPTPTSVAGLIAVALLLVGAAVALRRFAAARRRADGKDGKDGKDGNDGNDGKPPPAPHLPPS
jgi:phospholipase D1/2